MRAVRRLLKTGVALAASTGGIDSWRRASRVPGTPAIICHHRVMPESAWNDGIIRPMLLSPRSFARQLDWLARHYRFVSLEALDQETARNGKPAAAITFDDGYADVYQYAFPLLAERGIPATVFVISDLAGTAEAPLHDRLYVLLSAWWQQHSQPARGLRALLEHTGVRPSPPAGNKVGALETMRALLTSLPLSELRAVADSLARRTRVDDSAWECFRLADWDMLREMRAGGISIGSHTRNHALLPNEPDAVLENELRGSRRVLEERLDARVELLAYPDGRFDRRVVRAVAAAGYRFAFTCCSHRDPEYPDLTIPRRHIWENCCLGLSGRFSPRMASCQVEGVFDFFRPCRQGHAAEARPASVRALPRQTAAIDAPMAGVQGPAGLMRPGEKAAAR
jgi:peptidoglycan/xylan/chitin deacetylase (PgdA/CDA1 family)